MSTSSRSSATGTGTAAPATMSDEDLPLNWSMQVAPIDDLGPLPDTCPSSMAGNEDDTKPDFLFDQVLLSQDDIGEQVSLVEKQGFILRPLDRKDFTRGYLDLLKHLTTVGEVSEQKFNETFRLMKTHGTYYIVTVVDPAIDKIIGTTTLFLEHKFIHSCAIRGRIEDVVVDGAYRGKHLGKLLVKTAILLAKCLKCYKLSLDCSRLLK